MRASGREKVGRFAIISGLVEAGIRVAIILVTAALYRVAMAAVGWRGG